MNLIDLKDFTEDDDGIKEFNLADKESGLKARELFNLDTVDQLPEIVEVVIPDYVYSMSGSFFCGMFEDSYNKLGGNEEFFNRYNFKINSPSIWKEIDHGIQQIEANQKVILE